LHSRHGRGRLDGRFFDAERTVGWRNGEALLFVHTTVDHALADSDIEQHRFGGDLQPDNPGLAVLEPHGAGGRFLRHQRVAQLPEYEPEVAGAAVDRRDWTV